MEKKTIKKKVNWTFNENRNLIHVANSSTGADAEKPFVFALTRYKNQETHEESLKIKCFLNEDDKLKENGEINTYIYNLDNDIKDFMRYGVAFSDIVFIGLKQEIKNAYLQLERVNPDTETEQNSGRFDNLLYSLGSYFANDGHKKDNDRELHSIPINDFNDLALDCNYKKIEFPSLRNYLAENEYVRTLNGRIATLTKIKGKPTRVIAFWCDKIQDYLPDTGGETKEGTASEALAEV